MHFKPQFSFQKSGEPNSPGTLQQDQEVLNGFQTKI